MQNLCAELETLRACAPQYFPFDVADLDEIRAGVNLERHRIAAADGVYLVEFGPRLDWWLGLFETLTAQMPEAQYQPIDHLADEITSLWTRLNLTRAAADEAAQSLSGAALERAFIETTNADFDLLAHYREFTRSLCGLARQALPAIDLGWLAAAA